MVVIKKYKVTKFCNKFPDISEKNGINFRKFPNSQPLGIQCMFKIGSMQSFAFVPRDFTADLPYVDHSASRHTVHLALLCVTVCSKCSSLRSTSSQPYRTDKDFHRLGLHSDYTVRAVRVVFLLTKRKQKPNLTKSQE